MQCGQAGIALIDKWEGDKLTAYKCPAGVWTISRGVTGPTVHPGMVITQAQSDAMFAKERAPREVALTGLLNGDPTTQNQFDAMFSLMWNVGQANFASSTVLRCHKAHDYVGAAKGFRKWVYARVNGVEDILPGLVSRRADEARLYGGEFA